MPQTIHEQTTINEGNIYSEKEIILNTENDSHNNRYILFLAHSIFSEDTHEHSPILTLPNTNKVFLSVTIMDALCTTWQEWRSQSHSEPPTSLEERIKQLESTLHVLQVDIQQEQVATQQTVSEIVKQLETVTNNITKLQLLDPPIAS